jgi:hypothetical protein
MSRQRANYEPLYPCDAKNYEDKFIIRSIKRSEARHMAERKEIFRFCRSCGRGSEVVRCRQNTDGHHRMISKLREPRRDKRSVPTITLGEEMAYVGTAFKRGGSKTLDQGEYVRRDLVAKGEVADLEDFIEQAVIKIDEWPLTGDPKAVRVCGVTTVEFQRLAQIRELRMMHAGS